MVSSRRVAWLLFAVAWGTNHFVPLLLVYRARLALSSLELAVLFGVYAIGDPVELLLYVSGRREAAHVELTGPPEAVAAFEAWVARPGTGSG